MPGLSIWFIQCPSFHGATLLSVVLGGHPDIASTGDTNPTRTFTERCGCGAPVTDCPFWSDARQAARADETFAHLDTMLPAYPVLTRSRRMNQALVYALTAFGGGVGSRVLARLPASGEFTRAYAAFLETARAHKAHTHFVDGEKSLLKALAAWRLDFPVGGVIHLVRDPRAYAASCMKYGHADAGGAGAIWRRHHARIQAVCTRTLPPEGYIRIAYEDLARDPAATLARIAVSMGVPDDGFGPPGALEKAGHFIGNKSLHAFDGRIALTETWRTALSPADKAAAVRGAGSLFTRFGYGETAEP